MPKAERRYTTYAQFRAKYCGWREVNDRMSICEYDNEGNNCYPTKPHRCPLWRSMRVVKQPLDACATCSARYQADRVKRENP